MRAIAPEVFAAFLLALAGCHSPQARTSAAATVSAEPTVHTYRTIGGAALRAYVFEPTGNVRNPAPAILLFHGGGWVGGSPDWVFPAAKRFAALGYVAIPVQYRLASDNVSPVDAFADACAAFQWARRESAALHVVRTHIAAYGVSAGGHLAALTATVGCGVSEGAYGVGGPDALVLWSPAVDVGADGHFKRLLGARAQVADYSPVEHLRSRMPPASIVQGDKDNLTPLTGARRFCDGVLASGSRCELAVYPGVGHLLTRNLANQEDNFDPDPLARDDGIARQLAFLQNLWR